MNYELQLKSVTDMLRARGRGIAESVRDQELKTFASNVRRTGLTKGRDQDVLDAVRKGYLSESDAMNTDD